MLCDKAKEILMDESNVQVCLFIYSFVLMSYLSLPLSLSHTHMHTHTLIHVFLCVRLLMRIFMYWLGLVTGVTYV